MKHLATALLVLGAALAAGHAGRKELKADAGGGGGVPAGNGDVNGDGSIDVSDAVRLLDGLFQGGPPPVPIECPSAEGKGLPATGAQYCYDDEGALLPCDDAAFPGQDGAYRAGCPLEGRFVDHGDGTVTDTCTDLMWQKGTADIDGDGAIGRGDLAWWQGALMYCEKLELAGHGDWRLPNLRELQSLADYGRTGPSIDPVLDASSDAYWSSSTMIEFPKRAWVVDFIDGYIPLEYRCSKLADRFLVRAVRGDR